MENTKFFTSDDAVVTLKTETDKEKVLEFIAKDEWYTPYIWECFVKEIANAPLFFEQYKEQFETELPNGLKCNVPALDNSNEELIETARDTGLMLGFPANGGIVVKPTRYTAFTSICQRAGISGSTISNMDEKPLISVLPTMEKAQWLSRGFSLHKADCKILYRDGKVSSMLSKEYEILPANETIPRFERKLREDHPDLTFSSGMFSHEYLVLDYMLNDDIMEDSFISMLSEYGVSAKTVKAGVRFSTSDVGNSCVTAAPFYDLDGARIRLGKPICLSHDKGHSIEQFIKMLNGLAMVFKENEDLVEKLGNTQIKHPGGCFLHIIDKNRSLRSGSEDLADELDAEFPAGCTAIDVFLALNKIVEVRNSRKELNPTQLINLTETIAKLLLINYTDYDHDNTVEILNSLEKYPDIEVYKENENSVTSSLYIKKYQDNRFNKTDYTVSSESDSKYFTGRATERVNVTHYSFMGEHDFTDDEVNHYCKVMDKISNNILSGIYQKN